jgi:hypothetical protein
VPRGTAASSPDDGHANLPGRGLGCRGSQHHREDAAVAIVAGVRADIRRRSSTAERGFGRAVGKD